MAALQPSNRKNFKSNERIVRRYPGSIPATDQPSKHEEVRHRWLQRSRRPLPLRKPIHLIRGVDLRRAEARGDARCRSRQSRDGGREGVFMSKELVISASSHERRVAILEEGQLVEIYIEREKEFALVGSIYKGKVTRVLPGMQSAFVDIGLDGDAFLYVSDVFENLEDYDHGHSHGDAPAPAIAAASGGALIEPLPGETLSTRTIHEETISLDEPREEHGHSHVHG